MSESITHKVESRVSHFFTLIYNIQTNGYKDEFGINNNIGFNVLGFISEFELLKKELPETYPKYIEKFHKDYCSLFEMLNSLDLPRDNNNEFEVQYLNRLSSCLKQIKEHLKGLLNHKVEIQAKEQSKPLVTQMNISIYEKAKDNYRIIKDIVDNLLFKDQPHDIGYTLDPLIYIAEFDQIKQDYKECNKYLNHLLKEYKHLLGLFNHYTSTDEGDLSFLADRPKEYQAFIHTLKKCLNEITEHLKGMLTPETDVQQTPPKLEKLKPIEKILIVYYLNQQNKLFKNPLNQLSLKSGKYFLSSLLDINPESIKNPVSNISDYTNEIEKMTLQKALNLYPTLEKVKSFFDNSELFEISKVIETRINVLKQKAGKD